MNHVLTQWITAVEGRLLNLSSSASSSTSGSSGGSSGSSLYRFDPFLVDGPLKIGESLRIAEARGSEVVVTHVEGAPRNVFEKVDEAIWSWRKSVMGGSM